VYGKLQAMNDTEHLQAPPILDRILTATVAAGFQMASQPHTGSLLRTLAASKPSGHFLELGTGTGMATAWLLDGMDNASTLITVEKDTLVASIAQTHLGHDRRVNFQIEDAEMAIARLVGQNQRFDLIFADTWIGKYSHLEDTLSLLNPGGLYVIDDMLPQANWMEGHESNVKTLIADLKNRQNLVISKLAWASGIVIATKRRP
jgi:predicted O-methyltransferase YrrM